MKVLWLSNRILSDRDGGDTGTWLSAMAGWLVESGEVALANIAEAGVKEITRQDCGKVHQWVVPFTARVNRDGLPPEKIVSEVVKAVDDFSPDLIHVWGTENYWGLLTARNRLKTVTLLETQGLKFAIAEVFHGGLSVREQLACVGVKEILRGSTIFQEQRRFEKWGSFEKEMISQHKYFAVQTKWVTSKVKAINGTSRTFQSDRALREPFYRTAPWQFPEKPVIFCLTAYSSPFKGLHIATRAVAKLKNRFPGIRLRIAGIQQREGIHQDGYIAWLIREIRRLGLESAVEWLGPLDASGITREMCRAGAMLIPTYIENCCTTMQEAMMVGTPVVATYTGGLPTLARDEESALFFPPGDAAMCAFQLERVLTDVELCLRLSNEAKKISLQRNDRTRIVQRQLAIYRQVLLEAHDAGALSNSRHPQ